MRKKTRILAIGDIHADRGLARKISKLAEKEKVDLVIFAGDITFANNEMKDIIKPFQKIKKRVLLIPGNHEDISTIKELSQIYENASNLHGYAFTKGNLGIFGAGNVDWEEEDSGKDIFNTLKKANKRVEKSEKKIMVTHMHPKGSKAEFSGFGGSSAIRKAIKQFHPDIAICSHIHEAGGLQEKIGKTKVLHVSRKPAIFDI
jgi:uncharacterized protein